MPVTTPARPYPVKPAFPNPALAEADWADAFEIVPSSRIKDAEAAARLALGPMPGWVKVLLAARNRIVGWMGLKPAAVTARHGASDRVGPFPVVRKSRDEVVLGFDDRHLDFRIVISLFEADGEVQRVRATTLVRRHNLGGRLYLAVIMPFHKMIVRTTLKPLGRDGAVAPLS